MPYNANKNKFHTCDDMTVIGTAKSSWKHGAKEYENVVGVLLDVKHLMKIDGRLDYNEIKKLANLIEKAVEKEKNIHA